MVGCCCGISIICLGHAVQWYAIVSYGWGNGGITVAAYAVKVSGAT